LPDALLRQLLLGLADHRDFRDRIDPVREQRRHAVGGDAEAVADRQPPLLHRGRGERREPDHVADRVDALHLGAVVLVDLEAAAVVAAQPALVERQPARRTGAADRVERLVGNDALAAFEVQPHPPAGRAAVLDLDPADAFA
jgi:hypothetical protein